MNPNYLSHFGFSPREAVRLNSLPYLERVDYFKQELRSLINHSAQDPAVSIRYLYHIGPEDTIFTSPSLTESSNVKYQISPYERNGLIYEGFVSAVKQAKEKPFTLVVLYSPIGKKLFAATSTEGIDPEFLSFLQEPYKKGQLYFLYYDGQNVKNVAVGIDDDKNPWLTKLSKNFDVFNTIRDEEQRISQFITSPVEIGNVDDFFQRSWDQNHLIYSNVHNKKYYLDEVVSDMKKTLAGEKTTPLYLEDRTIESMLRYEVTENTVRNSYLFAYKNFMAENNISQTPLGVACAPGQNISISEIDSIIGLGGGNLASSFSTGFRYITQGDILKNSPLFENKKKETSQGYPCESCGRLIPWEKNVNDPKTWKTNCPHCGEKIPPCIPNSIKI